MMIFRTHMILAIVALAQASYLLIGGDVVRGTDVEQAQARRLLPGLDLAQVQWVTLQRKGGALIKLRRSDEGWRITQPIQERANQGATAELLSAIEFADYVRLLPGSYDRRELGLQAPRLVLKIGLPQRTHSLSVGEDDPTARGVYLALAAKRFVVERALFEVLDKRVDDLRQRDLWPHGVGQIQRFAWGGLALSREGSRWTLNTRGTIARAAPHEVERLLSALAGLRAIRFVGRPEVLPREKITVTGGGHKLEVLHGGPCPGRPTDTLVVQLGQPRRFLCVEREDLRLLKRKALELIDPAVTRLTEAEAQEFSIKGSSPEITIIRDGGYWKISPDLRADDQRIRQWFAQLGGARGEIESVDNERIKDIRSQSDLSVTLVDRTGRRESFMIGKPTGDRIPLIREGETVLLWFPRTMAALFRWGQAELRSRRILDFSPLAIKRITTRRGREREVLIRQEGVWIVKEPVTIRGDAIQIKALLRRLSRLRVSRFMAPRPFKTGLKVTILLRSDDLKQGTRPTETRQIELEIGGDYTTGSCPGRMTGVPPFLLAAEDCALLGGRRAAHNLLEIEEGALRAVAVSTATRRLELMKRGYRWADAQGRLVSAARMATLVTILKRFRAERITGYGAQQLRPSLNVIITHADGSRQEVRVNAKGRAMVPGRPIGYQLAPSLINALNDFLVEQ